MTKTPKTGQVPAQEKELTWREQRFIEHYIRTGNASLAAREAGYSHASCAFYGHELLRKPYIAEAIALEREKDSQLLNFKKADALKILLGMVLASPEDFTEILKNPTDKERYKELGYKKYAIQSVKESFKNGNEVKFVDRLAALDDLWDKLGLGQEASSGNWFDDLGRVIDSIRAAKGTK